MKLAYLKDSKLNYLKEVCGISVWLRAQNPGPIEEPLPIIFHLPNFDAIESLERDEKVLLERIREAVPEINVKFVFGDYENFESPYVLRFVEQSSQNSTGQGGSERENEVSNHWTVPSLREMLSDATKKRVTWSALKEIKSKIDALKEIERNMEAGVSKE